MTKQNALRIRFEPVVSCRPMAVCRRWQRQRRRPQRQPQQLRWWWATTRTRPDWRRSRSQSRSESRTAVATRSWRPDCGADSRPLRPRPPPRHSCWLCRPADWTTGDRLAFVLLLVVAVAVAVRACPSCPRLLAVVSYSWREQKWEI